MAAPGHEDGNGAEPAAPANGTEYANRLEMLDEAVEHVLLQLIASDFILTGPNGGVTRWGDRAKVLFGWETQRIVGSSLFGTVLGGDAEGPVRRWERFLADREGDPPPSRFAVQARHCDGAEFPLELTFVPVKLSQGSEFSFFVRDLTADLPSGAKLARLRRDHKDVLQSISSALQSGTPLEPDERLAGVLVAYAATGPTPWVDAARREAEEAAAALADVAEAGEKGGESAAADRMARTLANAKRAERSAEEAHAEREALQEQLTTAVERSEQLEREGAAMRQALDDARRKASAAGETAERAQSEAESAHGDAAQAIRLVRELERQTQEVRGQLTQARGDSGEGTKRLASLERATEGATERLARLEQRARDEAGRLTRVEESAGDSSRLDQLERGAEAMRQALEEARRQATQAAPAGLAEDQVARQEAKRLGERLDEALAQLAEARAQLSEASTPSPEAREAARAAGVEVASARSAAEEARAEAARSTEEAARARDELGEVRQELAATRAEMAEARGELTELRRVVADVREAAEAARTEAQAAGQSGREAAEQGERALRLVGDAGEQAGAAAERSEEIAARLAEIGAEVEHASTQSSTTREELATLHSEAEEVLRVLERSVGRVLSGGAPAVDAWAEPPAEVPTAAEPEPEAETGPAITRDPREGFDDVMAPMATLDLEGRFLELNPFLCDLIGYSEEEFRSAIWPSSLSDDATRKEHRELRGRLASGEIEQSPIETCYLHKEGLLIPVSATVSLIRAEDGTPDHLLLSGAGDRSPVSA